MFVALPLICCLASSGLGLATQAPVQVGLAAPVDFDLRALTVGRYLAKDPRDPAQVEAVRQAWVELIRPRAEQPALRLLLAPGPQGLALLLGAAQALKAQNPDTKLYLGYDPAAAGVWDETVWGVLDGGALLPLDLGPDPLQWERRLGQAQEQMPGRPWTLWLDRDPGALASTLLGDGGLLVVPAGGPAAQLASLLPAGASGLEGGKGDLTLLRPGAAALRWRFLDGAWKPAEPARERHEVAVSAQASYDVGKLLARMRATQLRDRTALRSCQARLDVDLHMEDLDLGYTFQAFDQNGESEELLQKEVRLDGVRANLKGGEQLPQLEARSSIAAPVALAITERFRYQDGGADPVAGVRRLRFEPVAGDPQLPRGEVRVLEASGRILEERSQRSDLPGMVKSEQRILRYGEPAPGFWRLLSSTTYERWLGSDGMTQVQRRLVYRDFQVNGASFQADRERARNSKETMLKQTLDGPRYYNLKDGQRQVETRAKSSGKLFGLLLYDGFLPVPVFQYFNFNALDKGIQFNWTCGALLLNQVSLAVPGLPGGLDFNASAETLLVPLIQRPVKAGKELDRDAVNRFGGAASLTLGRDLGAGFRLEGLGLFRYDHYQEAKSYWTQGFTLPDSGFTREWRGQLSWQRSEFHLSGYWGTGQSPDGPYGAPGELQTIPNQGRFQRWGGSVAYDHRFQDNWWLGGRWALASGQGFDRFNSLGVGVDGIRAYLSSDRLQQAQLSLTLPPSRNFRLKLTLEHGLARSLDDQKNYGFSGLNASGTLPGFWWFTTTQVNLGVGLQSDIPGMRTVNGTIVLLKVF